MKRIWAFSLILVLCGTTFLFARNNIKDHIGNIGNKYGYAKSEDYNSRGDLRTKADIKVDIEYPGESFWKRKYGVKYEAYGKASAGFRWGSSGQYEVYAKAYDVDERLRGSYSRSVSKSKRKKYFDVFTGDDVHDLVDYQSNHVKSFMFRCRGMGKVTRVVDEDDYYNPQDDDHKSLAEADINTIF